MALNVTTAVICSGCNTATATPSLAQWDQGQVLKIEGVDLPSAYQVEFSTEYTRNAIQKIGNADGVAIPNELLQRSAPITACIVLHEGESDRETEYWITIHITPRTPPETVTPDPEQMDVIDETIEALQNGVAAAEAAAESVQNMGVEAETLAPGSPLTVTKEVDPETGAVTLIFGLTQGPKGDNGYSPTITITEITGGHRFTVTDAIHPSGQSFDVLDGAKGDQGDDGYSPVVTITPITGGHRVTITDKAHPSGQSFDVLDGEKGDQGNDGYSPVVTITTITGGHRVTITDKTHPSGQTFDVMDGVIQSVNGKSAAAITLDSGDIEFDDSVTYAAGSIGAEVSDAKNAISANEEAIADTQSIIATVEATTTASKNYAVGDLLVYDGKLYKVTSAIATGATIIVGSNVTQTTVETQIASAGGGGGGGGETWYTAELSAANYDSTLKMIVFDAGSGNQLKDVIVIGQILNDGTQSANEKIAFGIGITPDRQVYSCFGLTDNIAADQLRISFATQFSVRKFVLGGVNYRTAFAQSFNYGTNNKTGDGMNVDAVMNQHGITSATNLYRQFNDPRYFKIELPTWIPQWAYIKLYYTLQ